MRNVIGLLQKSQQLPFLDVDFLPKLWPEFEHNICLPSLFFDIRLTIVRVVRTFTSMSGARTDYGEVVSMNPRASAELKDKKYFLFKPKSQLKNACS